MIIIAAMLLFAGCGDEHNEQSSASVVTNNDIAVNLLTSNMISFTGIPKDESLLNAATAKINNDDFDFSELTYSDDTVKVGEVVYVEGVIPEEDYPANKVSVYSDPESKVSYENLYLTNKDGNTVLTFDIVGEKSPHLLNEMRPLPRTGKSEAI